MAESAPSQNVEGASRTKFGTFTGVYMPTLTILVIIMYLRQGWVVGNAGLLGAILLIFMAFGITGATALAMSSITTNIRIGAGGAYSIITQSLGLEVGGSVGIPLYLAQALAITLYIFGFREGWQVLFPAHDPLLIDLITFSLMCGIAYISAALAFRIQYVILGIVILSLISMGAAAATGSFIFGPGEIELWGTFPGAAETDFQGTTFWGVFAVFFPAATGIMAGANMSGDLKTPRRSIPLGTMTAIATAVTIYILVAIWLSASATPEELVSNYMIAVDKAYFEPIVLAALLGGTFASGLASMVGSPRILQALGEHNVLPQSKWLSKRQSNGEPRNAVIVTAAIAFLALILRDLNAIAPLITMFFLITYLMINVVVFFEQSLGLVSFRPLFRIPRVVSFIGMAGCLLAMFIIAPVFSLVALALVGVAYAVMVRRSLDAPFGDMRSGMFVSIAEWAAKRVWELPPMQERAWKPNLLVAVKDTRELRGAFLFIQDLVYPRGSVKLVGVHPYDSSDGLATRLDRVARDFRGKGVFANWVVMEALDFNRGTIAAVQNARGAFPRPNIVFLQMPEEIEEDLDYRRIADKASQEELGTLLYAPHPQTGLGQRQAVNIWIRDRTPDWSIEMDIGNLDLSILIAYKLRQNWGAKLRLIMVVEDEQQHQKAQNFVDQLLSLARLPDTESVITGGTFGEFVQRAPQADINIFGMLSDPNLTFVRQMVDETETSCIFVRDSGLESALA